jgi:hypothetical protein
MLMPPSAALVAHTTERAAQAISKCPLRTLLMSHTGAPPGRHLAPISGTHITHMMWPAPYGSRVAKF